MELEELSGQTPEKDSLVTIGVFDGVHLGHRLLLSRLVELSKKQNLSSLVITFGQHPQQVLFPQGGPLFLTDLAQRISLLKDTGVDDVLVLSFSQKLAELSAPEFLGMLKKYLRMRGLVIGSDSTLGRNREAGISELQKLGEKMGFSVTVVPPLKIDGQVVSSTAIRNALSRGDVERAAKLAGRPFSLEGKVVPGAGRGMKLGFPTANLGLKPEQALPQNGVYATLTEVDNKSYRSVTNIGKRPTFGPNERAVEVHLLDYSANLYGRSLKVTFLKRLRKERQFASAEELKRQILEDVRQSKALL